MKMTDLQKLGFLSEGVSPEELSATLFPDSGEEKVSVMAKVAQGIGAWISGLFFALFLILLLEGIDDEGAIALGLMVIAGSIFLLRTKKGAYLEQLGLAVALCGHLLFFFGVATLVRDEMAGMFWGALFLCPVVYWFSGHPVLRFLSMSLLWLFAWLYAVDASDSEVWRADLLIVVNLILVWVLLSGRLSHPMWRPALWSSIISLTGSGFWGLDGGYLGARFLFEDIIGLAVGAGFSGLLYVLTQPEGRALWRFGIFTLLMMLLGVAGAPGIVLGIGLVAVALARGDQFLKWASILILVFFLISFYYYLAIPLNEKSFLLMGTGSLLLALHFFGFRKEMAS